jgi:predicted DNA-binding transcriptional regulator AlpA|tara:strand:- start:501 stop:701 length:201 start_codon:yes stop_codon:yes gene_type:complete
MKILNAKQVTQITNLSRVTLWRMERAGKFPQRISISPNRVGWRDDDINDWIDSRPQVGSITLREME